MLQLKGYQKKALDSLRAYLQACDRLQDANSAFYETTRQIWEGQGIPYHPIREPSELKDIPYVCLRLPTGGGKTLLACHAISMANSEYLKKDRSIVLWLVPSNAIREQTITALKNRNHAYRQALESTLGTVTVMDVMEALYLQQAVLLSSTVIIVATLQAFRVEEKEGRRVYSNDGALQHHFQNLPAEIVEKLEHDEQGFVPYSLANVLRIHRPLVIVDEAHNARTPLSFDTLARFWPAGILEFTATPDPGDKSKTPSNVLHSVSAAELKAEDMIKLPIRLETNPDWQAILADALSQLQDLEKKAVIDRQKTGEYIRPIMLVQAQPRRQGQETLTVDAVRNSLIVDHHIPEQQVARATGEDKDLEGVDLSDEKCPIRYIITVYALKEGWDCPFAYVLCSLAEMHKAGAVEQILGRILRLPYNKPRSAAELNRAYAFVTSRDFGEAAQSLVDALVENGFNRQEASEFIKPATIEQSALSLLPPSRVMAAVTIKLSEVPDPVRLSPNLQQKVQINPENCTITITTPLYQEEENEIKDCLIHDDARVTWETESRKYRHGVMEIFKSPSERGHPFSIPLLCIKRGQQLELFEEDHLLEYGWNLNAYDARLTDTEYAILTFPGGAFGEIDVSSEGKVKSRFIPELSRHLQLIEIVENWTDAQLIGWLEQNLPLEEITSQDKGVFLTSTVGDLIDRRGMSLSQVVRKKFELRKIVAEKIHQYRQLARAHAHQAMLFGEEASTVVVSPERCFSYPPDQYPIRTVCARSDSFSKHYYPKIGELDGEGEEFLCAMFLDRMPEVEYWVRNLERQERFSFWLQTSTDKFYPDFVCKLKDGRFLVVEYKGADRWSNDDSKEKRRLGELWALKSNGRCLFSMPRGKQFEEISQIAHKKS
jgi:type III restriction enzyme